MSGINKCQEINNSQFQKSKVNTNLDYIQPSKIFNKDLTVSQSKVIMKILPLHYSMHINHTLKTKRISKRLSIQDKKNIKNKQQCQQQPSISQISKQQIHQQSIQTINYEDMIKNCQKIVNLLKKNKNSWPFIQPVDPIGMGIPHYRDIITNPMDLQTLQQNLISHKYSTLSQFYGDIKLIINNSYLFNKNNIHYYSITTQFQKYFQNLKSDTNFLSNTVNPPLVKRISSQTTGTLPYNKNEREQKQIIQITQRKQIALKLKQLPKQQLLQLINKINDNQKSRELNLQTLSVQKVKYLQDYLAKKQIHLLNHQKNKSDHKKIVDDESSFESDSDS